MLEYVDKSLALAMMMDLVENGEKLTGMTLCRRFQKGTGRYIDWHEFSNYLDRLHSKGYLKVVGIGFDGMTEYGLELKFATENDA